MLKNEDEKDKWLFQNYPCHIQLLMKAAAEMLENGKLIIKNGILEKTNEQEDKKDNNNIADA